MLGIQEHEFYFSDDNDVMYVPQCDPNTPMSDQASQTLIHYKVTRHFMEVEALCYSL